MRIRLEPGAESVPGYHLVVLIGRGGFGEVWKAVGPGGFEVALKFVHLIEQVGPAELRALQLIRNIRHPHLLSMFGSWEIDSYLIIAMELAERTLMDRFREAQQSGSRGIPAPEIYEHFLDAAKGLDYLNEPRHVLEGGAPQGVQHRDVKPQNLLLIGNSVKVADFGLARVLEHTQTSHTGSMTPAYAAPEFFDRKTSSQSDQYSLAVTYCHLRGGSLPFVGSPMEVMSGHLMRPPDLSSLPEEEQPTVRRALAKVPAERWPSCRAFIEALRPGAIVADDRRPSEGTAPLVSTLTRAPEAPVWDDEVLDAEPIDIPSPVQLAAVKPTDPADQVPAQAASSTTQSGFQREVLDITDEIRSAPQGVAAVKKRDLDEEIDVEFAPPAAKGLRPEPSRKAVASLVLGISSFFCVFLTGIPAILVGVLGLLDIARSQGLRTGRRLAIAGITLGTLGSTLVPIALLLPAVQAAREAARRAQCVNNLKQIMLAIQNYHDVNGCLPAAFMPDREGRPMHSWRVAILPYLEEQALFNAYNFDVPWNAPANQTVGNIRVNVYSCPSDVAKQDPLIPNYVMITGPGSLYVPGKKVNPSVVDIRDGTSYTIGVVESRNAAFRWTEPRDLSTETMSFIINDPSQLSISSHHPGGVNVGFMDGSVRFLKDTLRSDTLRALITPDAGEMIAADAY